MIKPESYSDKIKDYPNYRELDLKPEIVHLDQYGALPGAKVKLPDIRFIKSGLNMKFKQTVFYSHSITINSNE
jgi:hypothetical protein